MARIEQLIGAMSLSEKLGQLTMTAAPYAVTGPFVAGDLSEGIKSGAVGNLLNLYGPAVVARTQRLAVEESRLRIPLLIGLDVIHGHRTLFPVPLGEAAMFDPALWEKTAREAAREAAADGVAMTFAPMCDVARDPRWGRMVEGPGEDPFVGAAIARAKVTGFQGGGLGDTGTLDESSTLAACAKHFAAYGAVMAGREYASTDISERTLQEVHLPAFAAAVEAGVASVMPAFTEIGGVPMTAHKKLLTDYLRGELGFKGVIISDYNAIAELMNHGVAADIAEAAALALNAGVDIDMMAGAYAGGLPLALERRLVTMDQIDTAVRRVLTLKEQLGLFDDPYRGASAESAEVLARRRALAREAAAKSVVLLKNENDVLPFSDVRRVAVIGPLAYAAAEMRGAWAAAAPKESCVTVLEGLRAALPEADIQYALGVTIDGEDQGGIAEAAALCDGADAIILCVGEAANMSGEAASRAHPHLPGAQQILCDAVFAKAGGKPVITILFSGRPLVVPALAEQSTALLAAWFPGAEAGNALADLLIGARAPSGRTPVSWPRATGQIPIFFGERKGGRPFIAEEHYTSKYLDTPNTPLFAFGHGLSYGRFSFSNLRLSGTTLTQSGTLTISIDVTNDGARAAEETVFLFVHDKVALVTRPLLELKGFAKIALEPGARGTVTLPLKGADLRFPGLDLKPVFEAGEVEILVGPVAEREREVVGSVRLVD
ncbi:MAG TPA: glycoside hydrolase family 3 N-terminal domain-containing protein [Rhizomicrobium sp.]|jgi:beta-glucosidase|nr:glycoside hydrolase family 3 N-terminal domain-containing protein [Rhizomicrobium sp.]